MTNITQIRQAFWDQHPEFHAAFSPRKSHNDYNATIRTAFNDFVDYLEKSDQIDELLARRVTLGGAHVKLEN